MILGHSELRKLLKTHKLVEGLCERELKNPEGCVFDLRLEKVYELQGRAFLGIDEREAPDLKEVASFNPKKRSSFIFRPDKYYLTRTVEKVNLPENITAIFKPRGTTYRCGLVIRTGQADPGYHGQLYFAVKNESSLPVEVELGARYVSVAFIEVKGKPVHAYRGQWQGGRKTTAGQEKQI